MWIQRSLRNKGGKKNKKRLKELLKKERLKRGIE
jgi:hypothetical protein